MKASKNRKIANRAKEVFYNSAGYKDNRPAIEAIMKFIDEESNRGMVWTEYEFYESMSQQTMDNGTFAENLINALLLEGYEVKCKCGGIYDPNRKWVLHIFWN